MTTKASNDQCKSTIRFDENPFVSDVDFAIATTKCEQYLRVLSSLPQ